MAFLPYPLVWEIKSRDLNLLIPILLLAQIETLGKLRFG